MPQLLREPPCVTLKGALERQYMPDFCTCGTQLVPDSLFCHKCGKPTREIVVPETLEPIPVIIAPAPPRPEAIPVDFHNVVAVRIALLAAFIATIMSFVLPFLTWVCGGFFAVLFYRRKTGRLLNVGAGVRMGWITGLLTFGLSSITFAVKQIQNVRSGQLGAALREQLKGLPAQDPMAQQVAHFLQSGPGLFIMVLFSFLALFLFTTGLSIAGGALGAKMVGRD
jgi:hypothetical protein